VRLGGDVNIIPGVLAARAGVAYETGSSVAQYQNLDIPGPKVFSAHVGGTVRINHRWSFSLAYAHHFAQTVDNTSVIPTSGFNATNSGLRTIGTAGLVGDAACNDPNMTGGGACSNNRGTFTSSLDVLSVGANLAF
jgi:long-subunit fatty acid transport protein